MKYFMVLAISALLLTGCNRNSPGDKVTVREDDRVVTGDTSATPPHVANKPVIGDETLGDPSKVDNTARNERDVNEDLKTPINQNENQSDIDITAAIRKNVIDADLSVNARNVKIITQDGKVDLRGVVNSDEEKQRIEQIAKEAAGDSNVKNLLEVKAAEPATDPANE